MNPALIDLLRALLREHGDALILGALAATAGLLAITLYLAHRRGRTDRWITTVATVAVLAISAEGMWEFATERLDFPTPLAASVFFVAEALMLSCAAEARRHYQRTSVYDEDGKLSKPGHPGPHGTAVWVIACVAGGIVAANSHDWIEAPFRFAIPLAAAYMWWLKLTAEGKGRPVGTFRWTPRRILARIGAIDVEEQGLGESERKRRIAAMTAVAVRVHSGAFPARFWAGRLRKLTRFADDEMVAEVQRNVQRIWEIEKLTAPTSTRSSSPARPRPAKVKPAEPAPEPPAPRVEQLPQPARMEQLPQPSSDEQARARARFDELVAANPDVKPSASEIHRELGLTAHEATVRRWVKGWWEEYTRASVAA